MVPQPTPAVAGPRQQAWFRALDHARLTGAKPTYSIATDSYKVTSPRAGDTYHIHLAEDAGQIAYHCDCPAGMNGRVCWHAALVAALPGECSRRRRHNARRIAPSTAAEVAQTEATKREVIAALVARAHLTGIDPLSEMYA